MGFKKHAKCTAVNKQTDCQFIAIIIAVF